MDPDLERWRGSTEAHIRENSRRLDGINGSISRIEDDIGEMKVQLTTELAVLRTKVALWSAIGGLVGAGVVSAVVSLGVGG